MDEVAGPEAEVKEVVEEQIAETGESAGDEAQEAYKPKSADISEKEV